jgi:signal transduction histidine kinase
VKKEQNLDSNTKKMTKSDNNDENRTVEELLILEEARKIKSVFLDNMSHELRTPITVILGYAGILYEDIEDPELKEMAEIILKSSNRLTEALNLLLDQSDVDSKRLSVELERKNLKDILTETYNVFKPVVEDKGLEFNLNCKIDNAFSNIDAKMFDKVMTNVLNNAVKYTEKGSVKIELESSNSEDKEHYCVKIIDSGIGIPDEKKSLVFEAFRQVSEGMNRLYQGTGLGLSVTKKFVELMNGEVRIESKVNSGTTVYLKFPVIE